MLIAPYSGAKCFHPCRNKYSRNELSSWGRACDTLISHVAERDALENNYVFISNTKMQNHMYAYIKYLCSKMMENSKRFGSLQHKGSCTRFIFLLARSDVLGLSHISLLCLM